MPNSPASASGDLPILPRPYKHGVEALLHLVGSSGVRRPNGVEGDKHTYLLVSTEEL